MVGFGILGAGRVVVGRYIDVFTKEVNGARVVRVCDSIAERADHAARELGSAAAYRADELWSDPAIDAIIVATESGNHFEHSVRALEAGKHVIVEKPPALRPQDVLECQRLAESMGLMYAVVFQNRYNPAMRALKSAQAAGRFGKLVLGTVRLRWCRLQDYYEDGWHGTWRLDGGVINQQAIHHVDALRWVCGEVEEVSAMRANTLNRLEAEDTMMAVLRFKDGGMGAIEATTAARPRDFEASISVVGERGMAVIGGIALNEVVTWEFAEALETDLRIQGCSQQVPTGYGLSHGPYIQDVIDRLTSGNVVPPISGAETVGTVELVHALYASTESRRATRLGERPIFPRLGVG